MLKSPRHKCQDIWKWTLNTKIVKPISRLNQIFLLINLSINLKPKCIRTQLNFPYLNFKNRGMYFEKLLTFVFCVAGYSKCISGKCSLYLRKNIFLKSNDRNFLIISVADPDRSGSVWFFCTLFQIRIRSCKKPVKSHT